MKANPIQTSLGEPHCSDRDRDRAANTLEMRATCDAQNLTKPISWAHMAHGANDQARETERQRDRETERQRDRESERQRHRETETQRDTETETQRDIEAENREIDRQRETQ